MHSTLRDKRQETIRATKRYKKHHFVCDLARIIGCLEDLLHIGPRLQTEGITNRGAKES